MDQAEVWVGVSCIGKGSKYGVEYIGETNQENYERGGRFCPGCGWEEKGVEIA